MDSDQKQAIDSILYELPDVTGRADQSRDVHDAGQGYGTAKYESTVDFASLAMSLKFPEVEKRYKEIVGSNGNLFVSQEGQKDDQIRRQKTLPADSNERKNYPIFRGILRCFPAALAGASKISKIGNDKHNPGKEIHHARGKSADHGDCILRHLIDMEDLLKNGSSKDDILDEAGAIVWRALALSQELHELFGAPIAPGAVVPEYEKTGKGEDDLWQEKS